MKQGAIEELVEIDLQAGEPFFEEVLQAVAPYLVGFAQVYVEKGKERVRSAGTGTFVRIGPHRGILTAGHVLDNLTGDSVGIVRVSRPSPKREKLALHRTHKIVAGGPFNGKGPDLGFLVLEPELADSVGAASSFYDLDNNRVTRKEPVQIGIGTNAIAGVVEERKQYKVDEETGREYAHFGVVLETGFGRDEFDEDGFDYFTFEPSYRDPDRPPSTYAGMSGGAWWRFFAQKDKQGAVRLVDMWIRGVVFAESEPVEGKRLLTSHGLKSIYEILRPEIAAFRW